MNRYSPSFRKTLILVLLCAAFFQNSFAQTTIGRQKVDQYPITPWGTPTYGLTWLPAEYNSTTKKYPLIIFLHGRGETGDGVGGLYNLISTALPQKIANGWDPQAVNPADGQNYQFIVVSPQAPSASAWSYQYGHVQFILKDVMTRYRVDPERVYVTGLSAGGAGTWSCVTNGPEGAQKFAAIVPVSSAGLNYGTEMDSLKYAGSRYGVKVWQVCGADDAWYSFTKTSTDLYNSGTPAPTPRATETGLPGIGHTAAAWNTAYEHTWRNNVHNKNIFEWMLQYKRTGTISTFNQAPVVNAGADQTITLPTSTIQLNGSASDPDGSIVSYSWSKVSGPAAVLNTGILSPLVTGLVSGTYVFRLTATDNVGETSSDDITINVNTALLGGGGTTAARIEAENWVAMKGVGTEGTSDAGGGLSVGWIDNTDWMDYSVNLSQAGTYTVNFRVATPATSGQLKLLNAAGATLATVNVPNTGWWQTWQTATATVTLPAGQQTLRILSTSGDAWNFNWFELKQGGTTVVNQPPSVTAGPNVTVILPTSTAQLTADAVDPDGSITAISWTKVAGPAQVTLANPTAPVTSVSNLVQGTYTFRVTVVDDAGATATAEEIVIVNATTPTTGPTQRIEGESWTAMKGVGTEGTSDAGGGLSVGWIDNTDWMDYSVNLTQAGTYTVNFRVASPATSGQLKLLNAAGATLATVNVPNTGGWQTWQTVSATVALPAGQQTLRVLSSSADAWNFNWFELAAGGTGGTPTNQLPTVNAGADQTITLPTSSVQLSATATDADGSIASYSWSKVSGPAAGSFSSTTIANPTFSGVAQGTYTLKLTVTDNSGATASDEIVITVNPAVSTPTGAAIRIQAESWTSMSGVGTEGTSDAGGGLSVGWIDNQDWMDYPVNLTQAGTYTVSFRVASPATSAQLQLRSSNGTVLATLGVPNTGWWQNWQTVSATVTLPAGQQTLRVVSTNPDAWNFNWFELAPGTTVSTRGVGEQTEVVEESSATIEAIEVFPGTVSDRFVLKVSSSLTGTMKVQVVDINGNVAKQFNLQKLSAGTSQSYLSAQGIAKGEYLLRIQLGEWTKTVRLVKL